MITETAIYINKLTTIMITIYNNNNYNNKKIIITIVIITIIIKIIIMIIIMMFHIRVFAVHWIFNIHLLNHKHIHTHACTYTPRHA